MNIYETLVNFVENPLAPKFYRDLRECFIKPNEIRAFNHLIEHKFEKKNIDINFVDSERLKNEHLDVNLYQVNKETSYYSQAFICLSQNRYKEFLVFAEYYIFNEKPNIVPVIMIRYYMGLVNCYFTKNLNSAMHNVLICIAIHPLMAEFWCLLGDIYFQAKEFDKSIIHYEGAMILGSHRESNDCYPVDTTKYKQYPKEMIEKCCKIMANLDMFTSVKYPIH